MKKLILLSLVVLLALFSNAQIVNIPDANFKAYLVGNSSINTNGDVEIQVSEANSFAGTIDVNNMNINNLTGIESFNNLDTLIIFDNNISTLDISNNIALTYLSTDKNPLINLDVSNNINLKYLDFGDNQLNSIDLSNNINLQKLIFGYLPISSIDLSNNINLQYLFFIDTQISSIDISNNIALTEFNSWMNPLTSLDASLNVNLIDLDCWNNQISNLHLGNNLALTELDCSENQITILDLNNLIALNTLICNDNQLSTLNIRNGNNINFDYFYAYNNPNLYCIEVDDSVWSATSWTTIDPQSYFSEDCNSTETRGNQLVTFNVYPNPFQESFTISIQNNLLEVEVFVYNILGEEIEMNIIKSNHKIYIDAANWYQGIYFLELRGQNKLIGKTKIIKV